MNRLYAIASGERRQLVTLAGAVLVFMLTLLALQLRGRSMVFSQIGGERNYGAVYAPYGNGQNSPRKPSSVNLTHPR